MNEFTGFCSFIMNISQGEECVMTKDGCFLVSESERERGDTSKCILTDGQIGQFVNGQVNGV